MNGEADADTQSVRTTARQRRMRSGAAGTSVQKSYSAAATAELAGGRTCALFLPWYATIATDSSPFASSSLLRKRFASSLFLNFNPNLGEYQCLSHRGSLEFCLGRRRVTH